MTFKDEQSLADILDSGPVAYGFLSGVWTSPMIARVIQEEFGAIGNRQSGNRGTPYLFPCSLRFPSGLSRLQDAVYGRFDPRKEPVVAQRSAGPFVSLKTRPQEFVGGFAEKGSPIADDLQKRRDSYKPIVAAAINSA